MRHIVGDDHRDFHKSSNLSVLFPRCLIDHFLHTVLVNGVCIASSGSKKICDDLAGMFIMARDETLADKVSV